MGFVFVLVFLGLFMLGFPVVYAILLPAAGYVLIEGLPLGLLAQRVTYALDSFPLVAVPLFIFVGNLMNLSGITDRIFRFAYTLVGRVPGGLAQVNVFGSLIFSGMSGAALADIGGLGRIEIDAMKKRGFDPSFAGAVTASSATIGPIFPPSIPLIVYGSVTSVSIVQLLVAGIMPAIVCTIFLMLTVLLIAVRHGHPRAERWSTAGEVLKDFIPALPAIIAPVLMIGGMMLGAFTPTEAAAVTSVYVIFISAVFYRELTLAHLWHSAVLTARSTSAILIIVAAAALFGWVLAVEQVPQAFATALLGLSKDPLVLLMIANLIFFVAGMFLDSTTATLLLVPIIAPPLVLAGVDPVQLGIVTIFNLMVGLLTPPMGLSLFLVADIARVSIRQLLRALLPFYVPLLATLAVLTFWKDLTLWLPGMIAR
ncbi:MAG: dicarboxylate transporter subunit DctM [Rhizobiaceae bacterium]|jgi:tripartite ATP-independent transporter DctM subunit|nr:dicarboxylate transporter subunit DctM [Rhizobiaceae bacterium]